MFKLISIVITIAFFANTQTSPLQQNLKRDDGPSYTLPNPSPVSPEDYKLTITLPESFDMFSGEVTIALKVSAATKQIQLNCATTVKINTLTVTKKGDTANIAVEEEHKPDATTEILTINLNQELEEATSYVLFIMYDGELSETSMHGFYKSFYDEGGNTKFLATTQFETTYARQAFPCFDEPRFKATFTVTLTFPDGYDAFSNTLPQTTRSYSERKQKTVTFKQTPPMSTYLVAFAVAEFTCIDGPEVESLPTRVCSRTSAKDDLKLASEVAPKILNKMQDYTGYAYSKSGIGKLDQLAIPDFEAGAMENWGLVTFREMEILWGENESSDFYKKKVVTVVAHELAHQWFGDLVTLDWWSDTFLNEGFATYFEYHASNEDYKEMDLLNQFVVEEVQTALSSDSAADSKPLSYNVSTQESVSSRFDDISYNKGGSILRMVEHAVTLDKFKLGLKDYIESKNLSNAAPSDLWKSFDKYVDTLKEAQRPPKLFSEVMEKWTNQAGYPLLTVKVVGNNVTISQERFLLSGTNDGSKWDVPISYRLSGESNVDTTTRAWLTDKEDLTIANVLEKNDWILLNNQQTGFYRVNYDTELWNKIATDLDGDKIDQIQKAQIIDDLFNLARVNKITYERLFELTGFLGKEQHYYPWYSAFTGYSHILKRASDSVEDALKDYIAKNLENFYNSTSFDPIDSSNHVEILKQNLALKWACQLNNDDCVAKAKQQFQDYQADPTKRPDKNLRSNVYCFGARYSDDAKKTFDFLWQKYLETDIVTEKITILTALGCITDNDVLTNYLELVIADDSKIRIQDAVIVFEAIYAGPNRNGVDVVLDFIVKNYKQFNAHFENTRELRALIIKFSDSLISQTQIDKLNGLKDADSIDEDVKNTIDTAVAKATENLKETLEIENQLKGYFHINAGNLYHINIFLLLIPLLGLLSTL